MPDGSNIILALTTQKVDKRDVVFVGVPFDVLDKLLCHLIQEHWRGDFLLVMVNKEVDQLNRYLQNRYIDVEVDPVQTPYIKDHMIMKDNSPVGANLRHVG